MVPFSALNGDGLDRLLACVEERLAAADEIVHLDLDHRQGAVVAWLHQQGRVLDRTDDDSGIHLAVALPRAARGQLDRRLAESF